MFDNAARPLCFPVRQTPPAHFQDPIFKPEMKTVLGIGTISECYGVQGVSEAYFKSLCYEKLNIGTISRTREDVVSLVEILHFLSLFYAQMVQ